MGDMLPIGLFNQSRGREVRYIDSAPLPSLSRMDFFLKAFLGLSSRIYSFVPEHLPALTLGSNFIFRLKERDCVQIVNISRNPPLASFPKLSQPARRRNCDGGWMDRFTATAPGNSGDPLAAFISLQ